jgi:8-oxo-dGTP diphosphatase
MPRSKPPEKTTKGSYTYEYPRAMTTVDGVVFGFTGDALKILLIKRNETDDDGEPNVFGGCWALPGGFVNMGEDLDDAVRRELEEETGVRGLFLEQLYTFGKPDRDPRGRVISIAYYALVKASDINLKHGSDADDARWFNVRRIPKPLAFDHDEIVKVGLSRLRGKVRYQPIGFELLSEKFTLVELQTLYETILQRPLDKGNFRRKILSYDVLEPLDEKVAMTTRPAQLYRFDKEAYQRLVKSGFNFEV